MLSSLTEKSGIQIYARNKTNTHHHFYNKTESLQ